jgi:CubicO group peptidase (beta-lactamase class C family)
LSLQKKSFNRRIRIIKALILLPALIGMALGVWMVITGPVAVYRILRYGTSTIYDFNHYPGRELHSSPEPAPLSENPNPTHIFGSHVYGDRSLPLDQLLETNNTLAFIIVRNDVLLYEGYFSGHTSSSYSQFFSVSKSIQSALIGMAIEDGYIRSVDQAVTDFVPELAGRGFEGVTIEHLLQMKSGSNYVENDNPFGIHVRLNYTPTLENDILGFQVADIPGSHFRYKSGDTALLGLVLTRALGAQTITDYAQQRLWNPMGMEFGGIWSLDVSDGLEKTWCCLAASARDLARFGILYLQDGNLEGMQILPSSWVAASTRTPAVEQVDWPEGFSRIGLWNYGYQWWLGSADRGDYLALGKDGQFLYIDPQSGVVIVRLGKSMGDMGTQGWLALFQQVAMQGMVTSNR